MPNPRRLPLTLAVRGFPLSFQRYSTAKGRKGRFMPAELRAYKANITLAALASGIKLVHMPPAIRASCFFFLPPMKTEVEPIGFSLCPKDLDNLTKAAIDGLGDFFDDRIIVLDRNVKAYVRDENLCGTIIHLEAARWPDAARFMAETLAGQSAAEPWLKYIQMHSCS